MQQFLFRRDMPARSRCRSGPRGASRRLPLRQRLPLHRLCYLDKSVRDFKFSDLRELIGSAAKDPNTMHSVVAVIGRESSLW
jgi:hypothetical protein